MQKPDNTPVLKIQVIESHFKQPITDWIPYGERNVRMDHPVEYDGVAMVLLEKDYAADLRCSGWDATDIPDDILYPLAEEIASQHGLEAKDVILCFSFDWKKSPTDVFEIKYWN